MNGCDMVWPRPIGMGLFAYAIEQDQLGSEQMAFGLPHGLKDPLRKTLLSQDTGVGPGVVLDGFDHGGALADALCVLRGRIPRGGNMERRAAARSS